MGFCGDPIQTVWDPVEIRYRLYGILYRSDTACMGFSSDRILTVWDLRSDTDCIGSYTDPIQTVWDPIQIRYRLYGVL
eukprot:9195465-Pyramimonas_sp.AAC.1